MAEEEALRAVPMRSGGPVEAGAELKVAGSPSLMTLGGSVGPHL